MTTKAIPNPGGPPLVGMARELIACPPEFLSDLANTYGDFVRFKAFFNSFNLISHPDLIREVLVTRAADFPKDKRDIKLLSRMVGLGLVTTNGDVHKRQRQLTQPAFHSSRIESYAGTIVDYTTAQLDGWPAGGVVDISEAMRELTMYIVAKTLFGADRVAMKDTAESVGEAIHALQNIANKEFTAPIELPTWLPTQLNRDRRHAQQVLDETINRIVKERRAQSMDNSVIDNGDLLSMLLLAQDESGAHMTDREVADQALTLFVAGHETTSNALMWTFYLLSQHPEVEDKLQSEVDQILCDRAPTLADLPRLPYALQVIKEAMRLYPPAWVLNTRWAAVDMELGGYPVRKGDMIWISPYALHRRPEFFPNPEQFDPNRFTPEREKQLPRYTYLPFGGGPRVCIGNSFALMEAHLIVVAVAQRFRLALSPGQAISLDALVTLSNVGGMHMRALVRDQALSNDLQPA